MRLSRLSPLPRLLRLLRLPQALCLLAALAGASAFAQGTINSGTTRLDFIGTPFSTSTGNANLSFGGTFNGTDMLSMLNWSYNQGAATSIRPFSTLDTPVASYVGDTATFTWANAGAGTAGFARFDAVMTVKLTQVAPGAANAPGAAIVTSNLNFKSSATNSAAIAFAVYNHVNMDIFGTNVNALADDVYAVTDSNEIRVRATDSTSAQYYSDIQALGAQRYELNTGTNLRSKLGIATGTAGFANLATPAGTAAANFISTDGAVAFQWGQTLAPGQSMDIQTSFTVNTPVPEPASAVMLALGLAALAGVALRAPKVTTRAVPA